jgi:hypothetical protein
MPRTGKKRNLDSFLEEIKRFLDISNGKVY